MRAHRGTVTRHVCDAVCAYSAAPAVATHGTEFIHFSKTKSDFFVVLDPFLVWHDLVFGTFH